MPRGERNRRSLPAARTLEATVAPADVRGLDAVFVGKNAAYPQRGGHLIFRNADDPAAQILRRANAAVGADVDVAVPEHPRYKSRYAQVVRIAAQARQDVRELAESSVTSKSCV